MKNNKIGSYNPAQELAMNVCTPLMAAKTRISARVLSGNALADTCAVKFEYHTY